MSALRRAGAGPSPRLAAGALATLALLLPFEPRAAWHASAVSFTALEAAAAAVLAVLAWAGRRRLVALVRRPPLPLLALALYAFAHLLSAALAPAHRPEGFRFALRMVAMGAFALAVAASPPAAREKGLRALVWGGLLVAALAVAEGLGLRALDGLLGAFREMPFNVGGRRRASAGSEYPNLAAAFLLCALVVAAGLACVRPRARLPLAGISLTLVCGLLFTYSRGALVAAGAGLLAQALLVRRRAVPWPGAPWVALGVLIVASALFALSQEVFRLRLGRAGGDAWYGATYEPEERALRLRPGEARRTRVTVTNTGPKTWTAREAFHLSYHWWSPTARTLEDGGRTRLPHDLAQGASVVLVAEVHAPRVEGRYLLVWDMVHEHTAWFSGEGVAVAAVPVEVGSVSGEPVPPPADTGPELEALAWRPTRAELWRVAFGMWAERPWAGFGPDSFRRSYGPRAGHRSFDPRVYANNTLLEAAATTGTLGAAALFLALVSSALAAAAARGGPASAPSLGPALFGLVVALLAHGVVDYVLAFTGHYLLCGMAVGSCAVAGEGGP